MSAEPLDPSPHLAGHHAVEALPGGWWRVWRHDAAQLAHFAQREMWAVRCACPAGIRLGLRGRIRSITLRLRVEAAARAWAAVDLLQDGLPVDHQARDGLQSGDEVSFTLRPEARDGDLEVWLPVSVGGAWRASVDADAPPAPLPRAPRRLLAIGDSITQGIACRGPAGTWAALLARSLGAELRNHGVGGHVFDADAMAATPRWRPDLITVAYGTNDWAGGITPEGMRANAAALLDRLAALHPGVPIALITPLWREDGATPRAGGHDLPATAAVLRDLAAPGVQVIDGLDLLPHHRRFTSDGLHPDDLGMRCVAEALRARLG